ncbi:hypothetical protein [Inquilinus sp. CA228]|uniref:hypothetical protein n=1 Tax=Inquilinus sp. CA228 TaxID=3455609 RepID=UPI003F8D7B34
MAEAELIELLTLSSLGSLGPTEIKAGDTIVARFGGLLSDEKKAVLEAKLADEFTIKVGVAVKVIVFDRSISIDTLLRPA